MGICVYWCARHGQQLGGERPLRARQYAHCSSICVTTGHSRCRQVIGYVGHTGRATVSHLHFEVRANGNRVNPLQNFL
ncbi:M23 family metallopeptidase [uncultured Gemmiger sp.]|uniref:M23 family metallopeptidase n=1 Tax=uncultured Gemmiger sp. TaxID=1623490 RepID=UPI0025F08034|nr:M23 family metallopeptidase [uncultured Gemmiger sp.]